MNFQETENVKLIKQTVRDFAEKEIRPNLMVWDESQEFPLATMKKLGRAGFDGHVGSRRIWRFRFGLF